MTLDWVLPEAEGKNFTELLKKRQAEFAAYKKKKKTTVARAKPCAKPCTLRVTLLWLIKTP